MTIRVSIPCLEGVVYREATGYEEEQTNSFGDPFSNAESMALRRAAANLYISTKEHPSKSEQFYNSEAPISEGSTR